MANTLRFKRGLVATIPTALAGEPLFTTDTFDLYIGNGTTNTRFQKYIASGATTQILRGDGSLYTFPLAISSPSNGQVLKYNGTSWVNDSDAGITGSGSSGQVAYFTGATTQAGNNNLFWDATNSRLGIGTNAPTQRLQVAVTSPLSTALFTNTGTDGGIDVHNTGTLAITRSAQLRLVNGSTYFGANDRSYQLVNIGRSASAADFYVQYFDGSSYFDRFRLFSTGNFGIGTGATDSGQRLQVTGDTLLKGSGNTSATNALLIENSAGTDMWRFLNDGQLLLGSNASGAVIHPSGTDGILNIGGLNTTFYTSVTTQAFGTGAFHFWGTTLQSTSGFNTHVSITRQFSPTSGTAQMYYLLVSPTINQTGGANGITRGLYVSPTLTAAADWRSIEWSNNSGWGLYGAGTANNYLAGRLAIGTTSTAATLTVFSSIADAPSTTNKGAFQLAFSTSNGLSFGTYSTSPFANYIQSISHAQGSANYYPLSLQPVSGNVLIGSTTDSGEKLQVTGTMKVTGATTLGATTISTSSSTALAINSSASACYLGMSDSSGSFTYLGSDNGAMLFQTPASSYSTKMTLDSSGNLGLGVTPSAWAILKGLQVGLTASISGYAATTEGMFLMSNSFYNGGAFVYQVNGFATTYLQQNGEHRFQTAASGTAGNNITFTRPMTLTAAGRLLLGTTVEGTNLLDVVGTARITGDLAVDTNTLFVDATNNRVGVLTTTPSEPLHVAGNMLISGANSFKMRNLAGTDVNVIRAVSGGTSVLSTATLGNNIAIGTQSAHDFLLCSSDTERIRLSSSGWFSHTTATNPSSSVTDSYVQYSADVTAGNAAPHFRTENGAVIKLYQETTAVGNSIISLGGGNSVLDDTTFDGYTLRQIVKALRNQGILA
jgi:hypothetical protein